MKGQESPWIINTLNWCYRIGKSINTNLYLFLFRRYFLNNLYKDYIKHQISTHDGNKSERRPSAGDDSDEYS
jgi:hypothetical protein